MKSQCEMEPPAGLRGFEVVMHLELSIHFALDLAKKCSRFCVGSKLVFTRGSTEMLPRCLFHFLTRNGVSLHILYLVRHRLTRGSQ